MQKLDPGGTSLQAASNSMSGSYTMGGYIYLEQSVLFRAAGVAVSECCLNDVYEISRWAWPTELDFQQEVEEQTDG